MPVCEAVDAPRRRLPGSARPAVRPPRQEEFAQEGVEGLLDGDARGAADVELRAHGDKYEAQDEEGPLLGGGFVGWRGEDGRPLRPAVADLDDRGRGEEGRRGGHIGEVALNGGEELRGEGGVR